MKSILLIAVGLAYALNSIVLQQFYPYVSVDCGEYVEFVKARNVVYECMFSAFLLLTFLLSRKFLKAASCFLMVLTVGSVIDKGLFGITTYLKTDILLVALSLTVSIIVYVRELKQ